MVTDLTANSNYGVLFHSFSLIRNLILLSTGEKFHSFGLKFVLKRLVTKLCAEKKRKCYKKSLQNQNKKIQQKICKNDNKKKKNEKNKAKEKTITNKKGK